MALDRPAAPGAHEVAGEREVGELTGLAGELDEPHLDHGVPSRPGWASGPERRDQVVGRPPRHGEQLLIAAGAVGGDRDLEEMADAVGLVAHREVLVPAPRIARRLDARVDVAVLVLGGGDRPRPFPQLGLEGRAGARPSSQATASSHL